MYLFMSFLHELLMFFISSFILFPSHIKRIILCFVYSDDHQPSFIYPSLEEEDLHTACMVDIDLVSPSQPVHKNEVYIFIPPEHDQPCDHENDEVESKPSHILLPSPISPEPCHQLVKPCFQPT